MPSVAHIIRRRQSRKRRHRQEARRSTLWLTLIVIIPLLLALLPLLAGLLLSAWLYLAGSSHLPTPEATVNLDRAQPPTRFYDRERREEIHIIADPLGADRTWLRLDDLPDYVIDATLFLEDADFLSAPPSFDLLDAALQIWRYIGDLPAAPEAGLTADLARAVMLPTARGSGLDPRLLEIVFIAESKRIYPPKTLLEWRLNSLDYGNDAYGIEAAARVYLGKGAADLSLAEAAILAQTAQAPTLNPHDAPAKSRGRAADLLLELRDAGLIDRAQYDAAEVARIKIKPAAIDKSSIAPQFVDYARGQAAAMLSQRGLEGAALVSRGRLNIVTTLDLDLQRETVCLVQPDESCDAPRPGATDRPDSAAMLVMDVDSASILSLVGAASAAAHQPAIALHPIVYMQAFSQRELTPASMVLDIPHAYPASSEQVYTPSPPANGYHGPLNLRDAFASQLLAPVVQVADAVGMPGVIAAARTLGFNSLDAGDARLELLEGGGRVSLLDTAYAYTTLASLGTMRGPPAISAGYRGRDPLAVLEISDAEGNILWSYAQIESQETQIIEPSLAYLVNDILADDEARRRTLARAELQPASKRIAAELSGSSLDGRDSWRLAYTPQLVLAAHWGSEDGAAQAPSASAAWQTFLEAAHEERDLLPTLWRKPGDIEEYLVCEISGLLPQTTDHCPTRRELMPAGASLRLDDRWQTYEINRADGLLATVNTPADLRHERAFFLPPESLLDWWTANDKPLPPTTYSGDGVDAAGKAVQILAPADYAYLGSSVDIAAVINRDDAESWLLEYGADVNPSSWQPIGDRQPASADGELRAAWQTALLSGIHSLRLTVTFADGSQASDTRLLTFDNTPPAIKLSASQATGSGSSIALVAQASDNLTIERVEFYRGDALAAVDYEWPHGLELPMDGADEVEIRAVAYDQVGNRAEAKLTIAGAGSQ